MVFLNYIWLLTILVFIYVTTASSTTGTSLTANRITTTGPRASCATLRNETRIKGGTVTIYCRDNSVGMKKLLFRFRLAGKLTSNQYTAAVRLSASILLKENIINVCYVQCGTGYFPYVRSLKVQQVDVGCMYNHDVECKRSCKPHFVSNGNVECTDETAHDSFCALTCDERFESTGSSFKHCIDGSWTPEEPFFCQDPTTLISNTLNLPTSTLILLLGLLTTTPSIGARPTTGDNPIVRKAFNACEVKLSARGKCGNLGISEVNCKNLGCCWDSAVPTLFPFCYSGSITNRKQTNVFSTRFTSRPIISSNFQPLVSNPTLDLVLTPQPENHPLRVKCGSPVSGDMCSMGKQLPNDRVATARVSCGESTRAQDWPWNVLIYINDQLFCGGTLIASQYVVTAGHCLPLLDESLNNGVSGNVFLGVTNSSSPVNSANQLRRILLYQRHPNYTVMEGGYLRNDIAVIKLATPVTTTTTVRPLCMPLFREPGLQELCCVSGFGKTTPFGPNKISEILQSARLPIVPLNQCVAFFPGMARNGDNICAGSTAPNSADTCKGDSGGSLACKKQGEKSWYLAGITSYGRAPCGQGTPSVYVNVKNYQDWIYDTIADMVRFVG